MSEIYQASPENQYLTETRRQLLVRGYRIIPNRGKVPALAGWNSPWYLQNELQDGPKGTARDRVARWEVRFPDALTTGLRIEDGLCVVDIDCDDEAIVQGLLARLGTIAPDASHRAPTRYGGGQHKMALFCRLSADCEPFVRRSSRRYDGQQLEIFGGKKLKSDKCSRQFGIYGVHSAGVDYCWDESVAALHEIDPADLPVLSHGQIGALCDAFDELCTARGFVSEARPDTESAAQIYDIDEASRFNTDKGSDRIDYEQLCLEFERYGSLRCDASFTGEGGHNRSRCWVFWSPRHDCVAVYVHGDAETHYPRDAAAGGETPTVEQLRLAREIAAGKRQPLPDRIVPNDFYAYMPKHAYLFAPTGDLWPVASINARLPHVPLVRPDGTVVTDRNGNARFMKPSTWLDKNRAIEQMSWAPGEGVVIVDRLASEGGWIERRGTMTFNLYKAPAPVAGNGARAQRWLDLVERIYPDHVGHVVAWCAHRLQRPAEKINHGLVLTGMPGIGKDTMLEPLRRGVGPWNFKEVSPHAITDKNNDFMRAIVLRISEARDLGDVNRYAFYETCKTILAAPPDMVRVNVKYVPEYYIPNVVGAIFTTNYGTDGLYLPADDRRHYVCGTELVADEATDRFCAEIWQWYASGAVDDIVAYLYEYDLSSFSAKKPPIKTEAFWRMVDAGTAVEVPEFRDALEHAGKGALPDAVTLDTVAEKGSHELREWLRDRKNRRAAPHRMDACGYLPVRNLGDGEGRWKIDGKRHTIYARRDLSPSERYRAAETLKNTIENEIRELKGKILPFRP